MSTSWPSADGANYASSSTYDLGTVPPPANGCARLADERATAADRCDATSLCVDRFCAQAAP